MKAPFFRNVWTTIVYLTLVAVVGVGPNVWAATPPAATLIAPTGTILPSQPTFSWSAEGATWYHLWISKDKTPYFTNWVNTNFWTPTSTLEVGSYEWWVQTWNADGYGPWSATGTFTVEVLSDEDALRAAVSAGGTYTFPHDGTVTLSSPLVVSNNLVLDGSGRNVTISGGGTVRVFLVMTGASLTLNNVTIANGKADAGAGIYNDGGTVSITASRFEGNAAEGTGWGGAIYNEGALAVSLSTFLGNEASGAAGRGGAICNVGTCWAYGNYFLSNGVSGAVGRGSPFGEAGGEGGQGCGGGIYHGSNRLAVIACTFASNYAKGGAGAVGANGGGLWAGGRGGNGGDALGGSICALGGTVYLTNSSFAFNLAQGGNGGAGGDYLAQYPGRSGPAGNGGNGGSAFGALYVGGANVTSVNNTFGWNSSSAGLGAAAGLGLGATNGINGSAAGGLARISGELAIVNTLIAYNLPTNSFGTLIDLGHNISSDLSCNLTTAGSLNNVDPSLRPLANNGGPTETMGLLAGSAAINAADESFVPDTDQRGIARPYGPGSDVGAYEYNSSLGAPVVSMTLSRSGVVGVPVPLVIRISNTNAWALELVAFTNILPSVISVAPTPNITNRCGGTITAVPGSPIIEGSGLSVGARSECSVSVDVICSAPGEWPSGNITLASPEIGLYYPEKSSLRFESSPTAITASAGNAFTNAFTLRAAINPNGRSTLAFFEWGLTTDLGNVTAMQDMGDGFINASLALALTNVLPNTPYFYRAVATNLYGATRGLILCASTSGGIVMTNDEAFLRANMALGGTVIFDFDGRIGLSNTLVVSQDTILDGGEHSVVLSGNGRARVFEVNAGVTLVLKNLTIADGFSTNGGGIYNMGNLTLVDCVVSNNQAVGLGGIAGTNGPAGIDGYTSSTATVGSPGGNGANGTASCGGAIYNAGSFDAQRTLFIRNSVQGGAGGNGGNGGDGGRVIDHSTGQCSKGPGPEGGDAGNGGNGGNAYGGALYNLGMANLGEVEFATNDVRAGAGGNGGIAGSMKCGGPSGVPGDPGAAAVSYGGAIYNAGTLYLHGSTVAQNNSVGGGGGVGGGTHAFQTTPFPKDGGAGGTGFGGGIANVGTNFLENVTIGFNGATGGNGGLGGTNIAPPGMNYFPSGSGGDGIGGGLQNSGYLWLTNCTIWNNWSYGGLSTNSNPYISGTNGNGFAATLATTAGEVFLKNTILGNLGSTSNCLGVISDGGYNLSSDNSCAFSGTGSLNNIDPKLGPLANNGGFGRTFALLNGSPAVDASRGECPATDERGVPRPHGLWSDIGAYEAISLTMQKTYTGLHLSCFGWPNAYYTLQSSAGLPANWVDVETILTGRDGVAGFDVTTPNTATNVLFRIKFGQ